MAATAAPALEEARRDGNRSQDARHPKHVFVTGGVASATGKGITAASLGRLLKARGLRVVMQKLDPYLNVDPGTMNPFEHGEVFVTEDGGETDLDLGHYERFVDENLDRSSSVTSGQIWSSVIAKERRGDYLGQTVQVIPHITNEIKQRIRSVGTDADVVITEVGGTVGDIEGLPYLEAIRQFRHDIGRQHVCYIHVALVPYIAAVRELKTKPTQHSVTELRSVGIQPDVLVLRSDRPIGENLKRKIALLSDVDIEAVISAEDCDSLYEVPLRLHAEGFDAQVCARLGIDAPDPDLDEWRDIVHRTFAAKETVTIGLVGKYVELPDAYLSVAESLRHAGLVHGVNVDIRWVPADDLLERGVAEVLAACDGVLVPGGFGFRGIEGKIEAVKYARTRAVPFLGICLGLQCAVIEFARNVAGLEGANSSEFEPTTPHPVIDLMPEQQDVQDLGGTMRLGVYLAMLVDGTRTRAAYGDSVVAERHRHRFEVNNGYRRRLEDAGLVVSGHSPNGRLVEFVELPDHPWFVATQAHPEFKSRPTRPHPLFAGFIGAAVEQRRQRVGVLPVILEDEPRRRAEVER